jgi:Sulfatase
MRPEFIIPSSTSPSFASETWASLNHSTSLCSPTRAALITGRNHHSVGFGVVTEASSGFPGYNSVIGTDNATIGGEDMKVLKLSGS